MSDKFVLSAAYYYYGYNIFRYVVSCYLSNICSLFALITAYIYVHVPTLFSKDLQVSWTLHC